MKREGLPASYAKQAEDWFLPLAERISSSIPGARPLLLGISGGQGTGKSTLARLLELVLSEQYGLRVARLSIDDFYLTRAERKELAETVHPLLMTRGVPGTHDTVLLEETLDRLNLLQSGESCPLPRFDKAIDDRLPEGEFEAVDGPVDVIILEGWCVGFVGQHQSSDAHSNDSWKKFVNASLVEDYAQIFERIDALVFLCAPNFDAIRRWRKNQETKLAANTNSEDNQVMTDEELDRFMNLFENLTLENVEQLTACANEVFFLDESQAVCDHKSRHC